MQCHAGVMIPVRMRHTWLCGLSVQPTGISGTFFPTSAAGHSQIAALSSKVLVRSVWRLQSHAYALLDLPGDGNLQVTSTVPLSPPG